MGVHASHAGLPYPIKKARFTLIIPSFDADGDPTDPATPDVEVSKDLAAAGDATEEMTAISGMAGAPALTLTGDEMNCSVLAFNGKNASGPKFPIGAIYPRTLPVLFSFTASAGAAGTVTMPATVPAWAQQAESLMGAILRTTAGTGAAGGAGCLGNQARVVLTNSSARVISIDPSWETNPDNTTTVEVLATPEWVARMQLLSMTQNFTPLMGQGVISFGTLTSPGGHSTTQGDLYANHGAHVGDYIIQAGDGKPHRIKTLVTNSWTTDAGDAFLTDPAGTAVLVVGAAVALALTAADIGDGALTDAKFQTSPASISAKLPAALTVGGRIKASMEAVRDVVVGAPIAVTVSAGAHTTTLAAATNATGYLDDRLNGRGGMFLTGLLAGQLFKITDYVSATGALTLQNILGNAFPVAVVTGDTLVIY